MIFTDSLSLLNRTDQKRFVKFVSSPYFNADDKLVRLLEYLLEQDEIPEREALDQFLYPGEAFQYERITNHISDLKQLLEQFLVCERLNEHKTNGAITFLHLLRNGVSNLSLIR